MASDGSGYGGRVARSGKFSIIENCRQGRVVHNGDPVDDFLVIKLKDIHAPAALEAYAQAAGAAGDVDLELYVRKLMSRAGTKHPSCKAPD